MSQVSLQNRDSKVLKSGDYVKFAPNTRTACVFALIGDSNIIGTCAEQIYPGRWGLVNLIGAGGVSAHGALTGLSDLDHPASAIINTPAGNIVATTVQAAINGLDVDKINGSGVAKITVGTSAPVTPGVGDIWIDSSV